MVAEPIVLGNLGASLCVHAVSGTKLRHLWDSMGAWTRSKACFNIAGEIKISFKYFR